MQAFANIFRMLGEQPVLRIGGSSQDLMTTLPGPEVWTALKRLHEATNCRYIIGLPLHQKNATEMSRAMMAAAKAQLGPALMGFELGNEVRGPELLVASRRRAGAVISSGGRPAAAATQQRQQLLTPYMLAFTAVCGAFPALVCCATCPPPTAVLLVSWHVCPPLPSAARVLAGHGPGRLQRGRHLGSRL